MSKITLVLALTMALCVGVVGDAHAWVQFCNSTNVTIWTTYEWYQPSCVAEDGSSWEKKGWWSLTPGQCKIVYGSSISNSYSYFYAEGGGYVWTGPYPTCTPYTAFDWCDNTCNTNSRNLGYRELYTGSATNYTLTFRL